MTIRKLPIYLFAATLMLSAHARLSFAYSAPDWDQTPGELCQSDDDDFSGYVYPEKIARCRRHVTRSEKAAVAKAYGVPESDWDDYEFDHLVPLCAGGGNGIGNIWPQPLDEAHEKDKVEDEVCRGLKSGKMTQDEAVARIKEWFE